MDEMEEKFIFTKIYIALYLLERSAINFSKNGTKKKWK